MQFRELTDRYQLEKILKSNRFGTVLRATDSKSGRVAVVKQITVPSPPRLVAGAPEFEKLAAALAGLGHPAFPAVLDSGFTTDGAAFLAMELLEGRGLDTFTGAGEPPAAVLARIGQALEGLEALAARGLAHLNVSPDNLFVTRTPAGEQVKLLGLGTQVFRPRGAEAVGAPTTENARFQAPEMASGGPGDSRSDLYSLALTTCHALGATIGFGESPVVQLPLAVSFDLENDEALRQALERALRKNPAERPSARGFREALRLAAGEALVAEPAAPAVATVVPFTPPPSVSPVTPVAPALTSQTLPPLPAISAAPAMPAIPTVQAVSPLPIPDAWAPAPSGGPAVAPQFTEPDPLADPGGAPDASSELLSVVDDEVLNALLSDPPPRAPGAKDSGKVVPFARKPGPPTGAVAVQVPAPAKKPGGQALLRKPAVLGAIALGLVAVLALGFWLWRRSPETVVQAPENVIALPKPPSRPPVEKLEEASLYLAQGEDLKARRVLRAIPWGEQGLLSPEGCRSLSAIQENLALAALERLPSDLASALKSGDLEILQTAVEAGTGAEAGLAPDVRASYEKARGVVDAYAQARVASSQGSYEQALERFATVAALLPRMSDPENLRGKAAAALEAEGDRLARDGKYSEGLARMEPIQRTWPDRPGFRDRVARFQKYQQEEQQQEGILAALPNLERHKKPWDGLQTLKGITPTPHLAQRFAESRARLEDLLARLDKEPPALNLRDGFLLDYDRGTVANLSFRATDDYEVKEVKLLARPEGGKFRELPLEKSRSGYYTVEIQPSFHQNGRVDFYVVARDLSGHETTLGSSDQPMQLKRKQGFEQLIR
jgi:hypothetical protein